MFRRLTVTSAGLVLLGAVCTAQNPPAYDHRGAQPIYRVTVISRTTKAINYDRGIPTKIDFRGTVLMPVSRGSAMIESKRGSTMIDMHFDHLEPPARFGTQYLTYVVWAI